MPRAPKPSETVTDSQNRDAVEPSALALQPTESANPHAGGDAVAPAERSGRYGRYELLGRLGAGGMGVVYRAHDPVLDRHVALKVIGQSQQRLGSIARDRLVREARALAKLAHPNVIAIHDVGQVGDEAFVAMELVSGRTLDDWLSASPRSLDEIVEVFVQASRGLGAAHTAGLVHRDFKPSNVIVGDDGRVRVLDFGLARLAESADEGEAAEAAGDSSPLGAITHTGGIVGTPAYMAPEQCAGGKVDERSDQFNFCVTLYQALYGVLPFAGTSIADRTARIVAGDLTPPTIDREVPERLRAAVLRGLAADPSRRHASMQELVAELAWKPRPAGRRRALLAGGAVAMLAAAIAAVLVIGRLDSGDRDRRAADRPEAARAERLRLQMIDNASPLPQKLSEHVRDDAEARRLGVRPDQLTWRAADGDTAHTEHYVSAADRATLETYLASLWRHRSDLVAERGHEMLLGREGNRWRTYYLWTRVELDGSSIRSATVQHSRPDGEPEVRVEVDEQGASRLAATTGQNIGRRMATVLDGAVSSAPIINGPILGGVLSVRLGGTDASGKEHEAAELVRALAPRP